MISLGTGQVYDKIQHTFVVKVLEGLGIQKTHLNKIKPFYKSTAKHRVNEEKLKANPLNSGRS